MAFVTSQSSNSSSGSNLTPTTWDVFLSFRGPDTRYKFTSHLYSALDRHGIRTFKDDPGLRVGEVISEALLQAIRKSKTYIVIFSKNYASSPWCLEELVEIYTCYETMKRKIIVVFYNIDPSVVRHQTKSFKKAFEKYETRFAGKTEKLNKWRLALTKVAGFSGEHIYYKRSEADIVNEIVDEILLEINPKTLDVAKYPVGLDSRVKDLATLLSSGTEGVIRFGIYGMGGVGKTTLAKALYNQLSLGSFKDSCFLANCREVSGTTKGLVSLQQQLINDVLKSKNPVNVDNVDNGIELIKARICSKKILVVIDDLDHCKQFECLVGPFASGSVVIITTRDKDMLERIDVEPIYQHRVNELDDDKSLTLFTHHAFGNAKPNNFLGLTKKILRIAGGLPLALEVFGSYLYKRPEAGWKSFIKKLQRVPDSTIQQRLIISLDALELDDPMLKKIFLDIACFLIGTGEKEAVQLLETYYSDADYYIDILKNRCLLIIDDSKNLRMHDLLRDMGREVSRNNFPNEPGKHSRLWGVEDICNVLKKLKGTEVIEGIIPCNFEYQKSLEGISFNTETFKRMGNLRFLHLTDVDIIGSFEQTFEELRWLNWNRCPLTSFPSEFYPQKLVFLGLSHSKIKTMQGMNMVFENLRDLNMSESPDLTTTPDFTKLPSLQTLNLEDCNSLKEVHISVGILAKLVYLNLCDCVKLKSLPETICNLSALEVLDIGGCSSLEALPVELGNIQSLKELRAFELTVLKLPESMGHLSNLVELDLSDSKNLESLPDTICNLRALKVLNICDCSSLKALPVELGNIKSLQELHMERLTVSELPDSIGDLHELVELRLSHNKNLEILPATFWNLTSLRKLEAGDTPLKKVPDFELNQAALSNLEELDISGNALTALPCGLGHLLNLRELKIGNSLNLLSIVELPPNLTWIDAYDCRSLVRLPNLSTLKQLEALDLSDCSSLREIQSLTGLTSLKSIHLKRCNSSLLACILTDRFFQVYAKYGQHLIHIHLSEVPDCINRINHKGGSTVYLQLEPEVSHNFLGLILCFKPKKYHPQRVVKYSVKNTTSNFIWHGCLFILSYKFYVVIVPRSIFSVSNGDNKIEVESESEICAMHLLYEQETTSI